MATDPTPVRDVVIVVPGIMGSELVDAEGQAVWSVRPGALANAVRTLGRSLRRLELPAGIGDASPGDGIRATALLDSLHVVPGLWSPVTGYDGLLGFLRGARFHLVESRPDHGGLVPNLIPFPYDWRLSNRHNGRRLARVAFDALERWRRQPGMGEAKLVLICHSMGGLVARWFAEQEGGAGLIRALIAVGTPFRGSLRSLMTLANGLEPGLGPLRIPLTSFVRSLPSLYQLLPQYDCLVTDSGRVGLGDAGRPCPGLEAARCADAAAFHQAVAGTDPPAYTLHKVVGIRQPTPTTARLSGGKLETSVRIDDRDQGGDGTVPRLASEPVSGRGREVHEIAAQHGELQGTRSLLDLVDGVLSRETIIWQTAEAEGIGLEMGELWSPRDRPELRVVDPGRRRLLVTLFDESGRPVAGPLPVPVDGRVELENLPEGGYRAVVSGAAPGGPAPVSKPFLVLDAEREG